MLNLDKSTWTTHKFGSIVRNVNQSVKDPAGAGIDKVIALEHLDPGEIALARYGSVADGTTFTRRVRPGQTLFGKRRAYQRKAAYAEVHAICSGDILVFEANPEVLSARLLPFIVHSDAFYDHALGTSAGSLSPRTNWKALADFEVDLPLLDEQERIADLLWCVEAARRAIARSILQIQDATDLWLDKWWDDAPKRTVGALGQCITGSTPSRANDAYWSSGTIPFLTPTEVQGPVTSPSSQWVTELGARKGRMLPEDSVLVVCIGGDMGRASVLHERAITNQQITAVAGLPAMQAHLLRRLLVHPRGRRATAERETTTIVRKLNKSDLMLVEVPWGGEMEQAALLVSREHAALNHALQEDSALKQLRSAVLAEVFGGES